MTNPPPLLPSSNLSVLLSDNDYLRFRNLVLERSGLHFSEKKRAELENGLRKALAHSTVAHLNGSLDPYYQLLSDRTNPTGQTELERLINLLTIGETYFFRDEGQFNALFNSVLPGLIARKRAAVAAFGPQFQPQLRIWTAGCATGEEPYSLAILLKELLPDIDRWHILILATDINQDSLARARQAVYSDWSFREARAKTIQPRYFTFDSTAKRYSLRDDIRQMVTFAPLNLIEDDYPAPHTNTISMDLILCRNVTIYFTENDTRRVAQKFHQALTPEGWLVVGHSEPTPTIYQAFQPRNWPNAVLYQKSAQPAPWVEPAPWPWPLAGAGLIDLSSTGPLFPQDGQLSLPDSPPVIAAFSPNAAVKIELPRLVEETKASEPTPYETAVEMLNQGHSREAITVLQRHLKQSPNFAPVHTLLGRAYANLGQWPEAKRYCQSAIALDKLQVEAYYLLGLIYQHQEQLEEAIAMLKKAVYLEPKQPLSYLHLAALYKQTGQGKNAQRACRNAIKLLEKQPPSHIIPHSGGGTANHLLTAARRILVELET